MENEKIEEYIEYLERMIKWANEGVAMYGDSTRSILWEGLEVGYIEALRVFKEITKK